MELYEMERKEFKASQSKKWVLFLAGLLMTFASLYVFLLGVGVFASSVTLFDFVVIRILAVFVGVIGTSFFGFCTIYLLRNALRPKPALVIDKNGIVDHSSAVGAGLITYDQIKEVYIKQEYIIVSLHDPETFLRREHSFKRGYRKLNKKLGFDYVMIDLREYDQENLKSIVNEINMQVKKFG